MWMQKAIGSLGGLFKWGTGLLVGGGAAVVADETLLDGQVRKGVKGYADKVIRDVVDVNNETEIYGERQRTNAELQTWGSKFLSGIAGFFRLIGQFIPGANKAAEYFSEKAHSINREAMQSTRDFSDQIEAEKAELAGETPSSNFAASAPDAKAGFTQAVQAGAYMPKEYNVMDGVHNVTHGFQSLLVNAAAGATSLFSDDSYSQLSTSWNKAVEDTAIGINKPNIDSAAGHALHTAAEWGFGLGLVAKLPKAIGWGGSIVGGMLNKGTSAAPAVQRLDLAM